MATGRPVVHFEILGRDSKRLQEFYATLFGWKIDDANPLNYGFVQPGIGGPEEGVGGGIAQSGDGPARVSVYVQVVSLDETLAQVEQMGGRTVLRPIDIPGRPSIAQFADPEGNVIGLVKQ
jgi:predicted enzyme related to lactoylglutathione lyase